MEYFYIKTDNYTLTEFFDFCEEYLLIDYPSNSDIYRDWLLFHKDNYITYYNHSDIIVFDSYGRLLALDDQNLRTKSGHIIWTNIHLDEIDFDEIEYFDFDEFNAYVDENYQIIESGLDSNIDWIYLKAENKMTHHRSYLLNWTKFIFIDKYILQQKLKNILS